MRRPFPLTVAALGVASAAIAQAPAVVLADPGERPGATGRFRITAGARVEGSGFMTIEQAPPSAAPAATDPKRPENERGYYAELAGVSNAEAAKRIRQQQALRPIVDRLLGQLRSRERGNYTDVEIIHRPDWAYLVYFKRDPAETLAKYTRHPRIKARSSRYTRGELERLSKPWVARLNAERLTTGYGMNARRGTADIDMVVSPEEFEAIARRNGWGEPPDYLRLKFGEAPVGPAIDPSVAAGIRIFAQGNRNLGATNQAALNGRIVLKDGCLRVVGFHGKEQLAYFPREVGVYVDQQGYLALRTRSTTSRHLGRIGEMFTWAGPIGIDERAPMVTQFRARCGNAPLMHVGIPESSATFNARYGLPRPPPPKPPS